MSEQVVTPDAELVNPNEEITDDKKVLLLNQWKLKVEDEINGYNVEREKIMDEYKRIKARMDKILGTRLKKIKKYDAVINGRKKVLSDILKEISTISNKSDSVASIEIEQKVS